MTSINWLYPALIAWAFVADDVTPLVVLIVLLALDRVLVTVGTTWALYRARKR
jgi:hypothetical protein